MGYMHIDNLYKNKDIMLFKECYAMEKIHGTSAHIAWNDGKVTFFSGGGTHKNFIVLFDHEKIEQCFIATGVKSATIYGESYGGKMQGMKDTYGDKLKFVAFEVMIGDTFLAVPQAEAFVLPFGIEFVHYKRIPCTIEALDAERDAPSVQAERNGCGVKKREGIVIRPLIELHKNNGKRIMAKHKGEDFIETRTPREFGENLEVLKEAQAICDEWVTEMRLTHVLDAFPNADITDTGKVIKSMTEDIAREAKGEIEFSNEAFKLISRTTATMFKNRLKSTRNNNESL